VVLIEKFANFAPPRHSSHRVECKEKTEKEKQILQNKIPTTYIKAKTLTCSLRKNMSTRARRKNILTFQL